MSDPKAPGVPLDSILYYRPSLGGNALFGVLYELLAVLLLLNLIARRDWWGVCLPIGAALEGIGFIVRIPLINDPSSLGLFIVMDFCIVLSPACYFAFNYIWFGRLVQRIEENVRINTMKRRHITFLSPRKFGLIFILSDVTTFLIQAAGGGMQAQASLKVVGSTIFLIGIIAQFVSYVFFLSLIVPVVVSLGLFASRTDGQSVQLDQSNFHRRMRQLVYILLFSSIWILVRSVYRTIELSQGWSGSIARNEPLFFGLDSAPLLLSIGIYVVAWPSSFVDLKQSSKRCPLFTSPWDLGNCGEQYKWQPQCVTEMDESKAAGSRADTPSLTQLPV